MWTAIVLGIAQGARHSLEPDHLAAVSVLVGEHRDLRRSALLGTLWGLGHTASLVVVGIALAAFGAALPPAAERAFDVVVAAMLVVLGVRAMLRGRHHHDTPRKVRTPVQAYLVGSIHGLAGSGALTAMVFATLPTNLGRLLYISLFGVGSIVGMAAISGAAGASLGRLARPWLLNGLGAVIGACSIAIGVTIGVHAIAGSRVASGAARRTRRCSAIAPPTRIAIPAGSSARAATR
ncbi:MAG TPA: hypothetical protein VHE35_34000 [Kofleriaceae bacterium]|nr:hypothetical protein [Kofleriaceae bacterium]